MLKNGKFLFKIVLLIYLFLALLGLPCCSGFSLGTASRVTLVAVCGLLFAVASLVEHRF